MAGTKGDRRGRPSALALVVATLAAALLAATLSSAVSHRVAHAYEAPIATPDDRMREGARHAGPLGWTVYCRSHPADCAAPAAPRPNARVALDAEGRTALERFNAAVNAAHAPSTDAEMHDGALDLWRRPAAGEPADCEDYVLEKRARLLEAGWPAEAVSIAVVEGRLSPYHAVLVLNTTEGELVLDNMTDDILGWRESGYRFVVRQSALEPTRWVSVPR